MVRHDSKYQKIVRLGDLFEQQTTVLKERNCPEKIINTLKRKDDNPIVYARDVRTNKSRIPFLPVITPGFMKLTDLMKMVRNGSLEGFVQNQNYVDLDYSYPVVDTVGSQFGLHPHFDPYFICDVDDGTATCGLSYEKRLRRIISQGRSPLTLNEIISLCIFSDILDEHAVVAAGSCWLSEGQIPFITIQLFTGKPQLLDESYEFVSNHCKIPSCGRRIG